MDAVVHWVELDESGLMTGHSFDGTYDELKARLCQGLEGQLQVTIRERRTHLPGLPEEVVTTIVTARAPWGTWRWIPQ